MGGGGEGRRAPPTQTAASERRGGGASRRGRGLLTAQHLTQDALPQLSGAQRPFLLLLFLPGAGGAWGGWDPPQKWSGFGLSISCWDLPHQPNDAVLQVYDYGCY